MKSERLHTDVRHFFLFSTYANQAANVASLLWPPTVILPPLLKLLLSPQALSVFLLLSGSDPTLHNLLPVA